FFQAEDGIRDRNVTGFRRVLFRSLVMKYARGQVPRDLGHYSPESAYSFSLYGTPEYFTAPQQLTTGTFPPPTWTLPVEQREDVRSEERRVGKECRRRW